MKINVPYGKSYMSLELDPARVAGVLESRAGSFVPDADEATLVRRALEAPVGSPPLSFLAKGKRHAVIISSDHTRPVPSRITMPFLLSEIRKGSPDCRITILVATGMHRPTTRGELIDKYGELIVGREEIVVHDAYSPDKNVLIGTLPSGGELRIDRVAAECDLLVAEGFIEPHFFAGFSGGRKSVLPGIASKETVLWNHNSLFISDKNARTGNLDGNPIHRDMLYASKAAGLKFILNVVINSEKKIIAAYSGDPEQAHLAGTEFVSSLAKVGSVPADIVITSNGGYPLDQNVYQTVKGMTAAERCVKEGGVIIICSSCADGAGGDFFRRLLADAPDAKTAYASLCGVDPGRTEFDQWEAQILARVLCRADVIIVSRDVAPSLVRSMHMECVPDLDSALALAEKKVGNSSKITVIPDGIAVIAE